MILFRICCSSGATAADGRRQQTAGSTPQAGLKASDPPTEVMRFRLTNTCQLVLSRGDITAWVGDAIVNAANERMLGGGGVDGAIHRAAGRSLYKACKDVPEVYPGIRCPTGEARITPAFELPVKYVIHTVGPVYQDDEESPPLLASAYRSSLRLANEHGVKTIAFPAISCGIYGYPIPDAAEVALSTIQQECGALSEVHFVLFGNDTFQPFMKEAKMTLAPVTGEAAAAPTATAAAAAALREPDAEGSPRSGSGTAAEQVVLEEQPDTIAVHSPAVSAADIGLGPTAHAPQSATPDTGRADGSAAGTAVHMDAARAAAQRVVAGEVLAAAGGAGEVPVAATGGAGGVPAATAAGGGGVDAAMRDATQAGDEQAMPDASQRPDEAAMMEVSQRRDPSEL